MEKPRKQQPIKQKPTINKPVYNNTSNNNIYQPQQQAPVLQPPANVVDNSNTYKVLYAYASTAANQLSINVGDVLEIVRQGDPGGWWLAKKGGVEGWVPSAYIEKVVEKRTLIPVTNNYPSQSPQNSIKRPPMQANPGNNSTPKLATPMASNVVTMPRAAQQPQQLQSQPQPQSQGRVVRPVRPQIPQQPGGIRPGGPPSIPKKPSSLQDF